MKNYSQRNEQEHILNYFKDQKGTFIDIGAYNPEVFSNVRGLFEMGWKGVLIDPSPSCFPALEKAYKDTDCETYNIGIFNHSGTLPEYWDSRGDALSTTDRTHKDKWAKGKYKVEFIEMFNKIPCVTVNDLIAMSKFKTFDFISIDVENDQLGFDILRQFDLTNTKMICLECEGTLRLEVAAYLKEFRLIYTSPENILLCR